LLLLAMAGISSATSQSTADTANCSFFVVAAVAGAAS